MSFILFNNTQCGGIPVGVGVLSVEFQGYLIVAHSTSNIDGGVKIVLAQMGWLDRILLLIQS